MPSAPAKTASAAKTSATAKSAAKTATKPPSKPAAKKPAPKPAAKPALSPAVAVKVTEDATSKPKAAKPAVVDGPVLRGKDLVARVAEATGAKVKTVRPLVEATLAELGKALDLGHTLQLPPLGKLSVSPRKSDTDTSPIKLKLRRASEANGKKASKKETLAEPGEAS